MLRSCPTHTAPHGPLSQKRWQNSGNASGPAREMHPMFEDQVIPRLQKEGIFPEIDCYLQIRTAGIGESALAEMVEPLLEGVDGLILGYCAHAGMVDLGSAPLIPIFYPNKNCIS